MAIKLTGVFHVIEWVRTTILLVAICIGTNVMSIWYVTSLNTVFGVAVFLYLHVVFFSTESEACKES